MSKCKRRRQLALAEWKALAARQQEIERLMGECDTILARSQTVAGMGPFRRAWGRVQALRARLEDMACSEGQDGIALFHGPQWTYQGHWR